MSPIIFLHYFNSYFSWETRGKDELLFYIQEVTALISLPDYINYLLYLPKSIHSTNSFAYLLYDRHGGQNKVLLVFVTAGPTLRAVGKNKKNADIKIQIVKKSTWKGHLPYYKCDWLQVQKFFLNEYI